MFTSTYEEWLETLYRPVAGADGEEDEETAPAAGGDEDDEESTEESTEESNEDDEEDSEESSDDEADDELDEAGRLRKDLDKTRKELASAQVAIRKAKAEARKAREQAAKKGGNWEQVAKEREEELGEANERLQQIEERAVKAEEDLDAFRREVRVTRIATKLHFRDPQDAIDALAKKPEATSDDKACERALRKLAEEKSYLVDGRRARGRAMGDGNGSGTLSKEQMEKMTPEEINEAWEAGTIQTSLTRGG